MDGLFGSVKTVCKRCKAEIDDERTQSGWQGNIHYTAESSHCPNCGWIGSNNTEMVAANEAGEEELRDIQEAMDTWLDDLTKPAKPKRRARRK